MLHKQGPEDLYHEGAMWYLHWMARAGSRGLGCAAAHRQGESLQRLEAAAYNQGVHDSARGVLWFCVHELICSE